MSGLGGFQPPYPPNFLMRKLPFVNKQGLDRNYFVTFRLGLAWTKRVKPGDWVELTHKGQVIGHAHVDGFYVGRVKTVIRRYGKWHHLEEFPWRPGVIQRRFDSLKKLYGPKKLNEDSIITAIILQRKDR